MTGVRWHYLRDWVKVARELPKARGHYPDGAVVALVFSFCKAAEQPDPGTFDSVPILRAILDATGQKRGKWVAFLIEHGDIEVADDGSATLPNWKTFQEEGRSTPRVQKHRAAKREQQSNAGETLQEHSRAHGRRELPSGVDERLTYGERERDDARSDAFDVVEVVEGLTNRPFGFTVGSRVFDTLAADVKDFGADRVLSEYRAVKDNATGPVDAAGVVFGGHKRLFPIPDGPRPLRAPAKGKGFNPTSDEAWDAFGGKDVA